MLVSTLSAFEKYQNNAAWAWEHQALTRARFCAGDTGIGQRFDLGSHTVTEAELVDFAPTLVLTGIIAAQVETELSFRIP